MVSFKERGHFFLFVSTTVVRRQRNPNFVHPIDGVKSLKEAWVAAAVGRRILRLCVRLLGLGDLFVLHRAPKLSLISLQPCSCLSCVVKVAACVLAFDLRREVVMFDFASSAPHCYALNLWRVRAFRRNQWWFVVWLPPVVPWWLCIFFLTPLVWEHSQCPLNGNASFWAPFDLIVCSSVSVP